jgi:F1F0 ATPase subunit 2
MTNDPFFALTSQNVGMLLLAFIAGAILSVIYFGGLWLTVQKLSQVKAPALLFAGSFLFRMAFVLAGFYLVAGGRLDRLVVCLISFFITRQLVFKRVQTSHTQENKDHGF